MIKKEDQLISLFGSMPPKGDRSPMDWKSIRRQAKEEWLKKLENREQIKQKSDCISFWWSIQRKTTNEPADSASSFPAYNTLKYRASGWAKTIAETDASGSII